MNSRKRSWDKRGETFFRQGWDLDRGLPRLTEGHAMGGSATGGM